MKLEGKLMVTYNFSMKCLALIMAIAVMFSNLFAPINLIASGLFLDEYNGYEVGVGFESEITTPSAVEFVGIMPLSGISDGNIIYMCDPDPQPSGTGWTFSNYRYTISDGGNVIVRGISTTNLDSSIIVNGTATVTLEDVTIEASSPIIVSNGADLTLILEGVNRLTAGNEYTTSAINLPGTQLDSATLTINSYTNGVLYADGGGSRGSGIGGGYLGGNTINILGGTINATGVGNGAGIGSTTTGGFGTINIRGGVVHAVGGTYGSGIGGGQGLPGSEIAGGTINISGGRVYASGGFSRGAGIGNSWHGYYIEINIYGDAVVEAQAGRGTGIGVAQHSENVVINIYGNANVTARSGRGGHFTSMTGFAGIGAHFISTNVEINISGEAEVTAYGEEYGGIVGIGGSDVKININGNPNVTAVGSAVAPGIGSAGITQDAIYETEITISGGTIYARGGGRSDMVAGNSGIRGDTIIIRGDANVTAHGNYYAAGIGGIGSSVVSHWDSGGDITIEYPAIVNAFRGEGNAMSIGRGGGNATTGDIGTLTFNNFPTSPSNPTVTVNAPGILDFLWVEDLYGLDTRPENEINVSQGTSCCTLTVNAVRHEAIANAITYQWFAIPSGYDGNSTPIGTNHYTLSIPTDDLGTFYIYVRVSLADAEGFDMYYGVAVVTVIPAPPVIYSYQVPTGNFGQPYNFTFEASGFELIWTPGYNFPPGLSLNPVTGEITGIPTDANFGDSWGFSVRATDPYGRYAIGSFPITINRANQSAAPTIEGESTRNVTIDYEPFILTASGGANAIYGSNELVWYSTNPTVATITRNDLTSGLVTVMGTGSTNISVMRVGDRNHYNSPSSVAVLLTVEAPTLTGTAEITGTNRIGQQLTVSTNNITGGSGTFNFQWQANGVDIPGANNDTFTLTGTQAGSAITSIITRENTNGDIIATFDNSQTVPFNIIVTMSDNVGSDNIALSRNYGRMGDEITINYTLSDGNGYLNSLLHFTGATGIPRVDTRGTGTLTYTLNEADAVSGEVRINANFIHTNLQLRTLEFAESTVVRSFGDQPFTNIATPSSGGGTITYSSSNQNVATVDNSGTVTIHNTGQTIITAEIESDDIYIEITATYTLTVNNAIPLAPTGLSHTNETATGASDGTITGVNSTMEWRTANTAIYTPIASGQTSISNLTAGVYHVRYAARDNFAASADATITIRTLDSGDTDSNEPPDRLFNRNDIAAINRIIAQNNLNATIASPDDGTFVPDDWTFATWSNDIQPLFARATALTDTEYRLTELRLNSRNLTGVLDVHYLDRLTYLDVSYNHLTGINVDGLQLLVTLNVRRNNMASRANVIGLSYPQPPTIYFTFYEQNAAPPRPSPPPSSSSGTGGNENGNNNDSRNPRQPSRRTVRQSNNANNNEDNNGEDNDNDDDNGEGNRAGSEANNINENDTSQTVDSNVTSPAPPAPPLTGSATVSQEAINQITTPTSAIHAVEQALNHLMGDAGTLTFANNSELASFAELAIAQAASHSIDSNSIIVNQPNVEYLQNIAQYTYAHILEMLGAAGHEFNRDLNTSVTFITTTHDQIDVLVEPSAMFTNVDRVWIRTPHYDLSFTHAFIMNNADIPLSIYISSSAENELGTPMPVAQTLMAGDVPELFAQMLQVESGDDSRSYTVTFSRPVTESVRLSVPPISGDPAYQTVLSSTGQNAGGNHNPATGMLDARVSESGTYTVVENRLDFADIQNRSQEMQRAIRTLAAKGIIDGVTPTEFRPDDPLTRAQVAALITRVLGINNPNADGGFSDVNRGDWFFGAVGTASRHNIMTGTGGGMFSPHTNTPRDQLVALTARVLRTEMRYRNPTNPMNYLSEFTDVGDFADWSLADLSLATRENLVVRRADGRFMPNATITRGEAAIILYRLYRRI